MFPVLTYDAMGGDGEGEDDSFGPQYDTPPVSYKKLLPPGVLHPGMPDVRAVKPATTSDDDDKAGGREEGLGRPDGKDGTKSGLVQIRCTLAIRGFFNFHAFCDARPFLDRTLRWLWIFFFNPLLPPFRFFQRVSSAKKKKR